MNPMTRISVLAVGLLAVQGCNCGLFKKEVTVNLNPNPVITIATNGEESACFTEKPILISPSAAGKDYLDNKDRIDKSALEAIELEVTQIYPDNATAKLLSAALVLTNQNPNASHKSVELVLGAPVDIAPGASNTVTVFTPDPADFLLEVLQKGDDFTVTASCTVDHAPAHLDLKIHLRLKVTISIL
jgi:hypothetical protein